MVSVTQSARPSERHLAGGSGNALIPGDGKLQGDRPDELRHAAPRATALARTGRIPVARIEPSARPVGCPMEDRLRPGMSSHRRSGRMSAEHYSPAGAGILTPRPAGSHRRSTESFGEGYLPRRRRPDTTAAHRAAGGFVFQPTSGRGRKFFPLFLRNGMAACEAPAACIVTKEGVRPDLSIRPKSFYILPDTLPAP
jgi:hypothetical protein